MKSFRIACRWIVLLAVGSELAQGVCAQTTSTVRAGFIHPGVLVNRAQLDLIKSQIGAGPRMAAFEALKKSRYSSLDYTPRPRSLVDCGAYSTPNNGCSEEREDAIAAYSHALMWYLTDKPQHAEKAIEIMNAWADTLTEGHSGHNARLQAGWAGCMWPAAGEIIRHTYGNWSERDVTKFVAFLKSQYVDKVSESIECYNGNWELIMDEAMINLAVFTDDRTLFEQAIERWRARVPAYIYMSSDGAGPVPPPNCGRRGELLTKFWYGQTTFVDGVAQETCRDFGHVMWGIGASINVAETARQQGVDLYAEQGERLIAALEFHAKYLLGEPVPQWLGGGRLNLRGRSPTWEVGYNHFHNRLGKELPYTQKYLARQRVRPTGAGHFLAWESLTHADAGSVGLEGGNRGKQ